MASLEEATPARGGAGGPRGRGRGRGRGNSNGRGRRGRDGAATPGQDRATNPQPQDGPTVSARAQVLKQQTQAAAAAAAAADDVDGDGDGDAEICFICANPVAYHSVAPCNHATCHICGLRMRALYKTIDCAHCRTPAPWVIFTDSTSKRFEEYADRDITTIDSNIGIKYTNEDIVGDTVLLLRYNCPDDSCDFAGLGWPDLHRHVKQVHRKRMCDLCTRNKKVFTHEHELFSDKELDKHMRRGDDKPGAADQTGFKGHPLCGFCGERFYDDDKLYEHCRMKHERCFICDRQDSRHPHYYLDYDALEQHFRKDHYLCSNSECMEKKFVVFESVLDLQAHNLTEHAGRTVGRDARLVDMSSFDYRQSYQTERRAQRDGGAGAGGEGRGRNRRGGGAGGGRGRDPNVDVVSPTSAQPLRRDELALQRQLAIHSAQSVSNRSFGGQLSTPSASGAPVVRDSASSSRGNANQNGRDAPAEAMESLTATTVTDTSNLSPEERARLVRHSSVIERAANLVGNDGDKISTFRQQISTYRRGDMTAPQLVDAFFTLFADVSPNALGTLVREVADLFEDKTKADGVRKAWQDWRAMNEDYPSLPGIGGMHGATSSSSGWANAAAASPAVPNASPAQKHSHRVLRLKTSTRLGGGPSAAPSGRSSGGGGGGVRTLPSRASSSVAQQQRVSASPAAFPSLPSVSTSASASASAASSRPGWAEPSSQASSQPLPGLAARGQDVFPALPAAPKPSTTIWGYGSGRGVRRDYGQAESNFQWGQAASAGPASAAHADPEADEVKGKKGKKGKKVLVQWG